MLVEASEFRRMPFNTIGDKSSHKTHLEALLKHVKCVNKGTLQDTLDKRSKTPVRLGGEYIHLNRRPEQTTRSAMSNYHEPRIETVEMKIPFPAYGENLRKNISRNLISMKMGG